MYLSSGEVSGGRAKPGVPCVVKPRLVGDRYWPGNWPGASQDTFCPLTTRSLESKVKGRWRAGLFFRRGRSVVLALGLGFRGPEALLVGPMGQGGTGQRKPTFLHCPPSAQHAPPAHNRVRLVFSNVRLSACPPTRLHRRKPNSPSVPEASGADAESSEQSGGHVPGAATRCPRGDLSGRSQGSGSGGGAPAQTPCPWPGRRGLHVFLGGPCNPAATAAASSPRPPPPPRNSCPGRRRGRKGWFPWRQRLHLEQTSILPNPRLTIDSFAAAPVATLVGG